MLMLLCCRQLKWHLRNCFLKVEMAKTSWYSFKVKGKKIFFKCKKISPVHQCGCLEFAARGGGGGRYDSGA